MAYVIFLFGWAFINTTDLEGHTLYLPYWRNRSGALAASQFTSIIALGTKNNIVSFITEIGYDKERLPAILLCYKMIFLQARLCPSYDVQSRFHLALGSRSEIVWNASFQPFLEEPWLRCGMSHCRIYHFPCAPSERMPTSLSSTFISPWFSPSSSVLISAQDMTHLPIGSTHVS
ncbi:hypothetical protein M405DRAFT_859149 [Rhizopogon salebrosus TDB-379]|nr:hypothetical protein M405DRAFT_859149 [Rhizopogon salebrosus TDB-379]